MGPVKRLVRRVINACNEHFQEKVPRTLQNEGGGEFLLRKSSHVSSYNLGKNATSRTVGR